MCALCKFPLNRNQSDRNLSYDLELAVDLESFQWIIYKVKI